MTGTDAQACSVTHFPSGFTWNEFNITVAKTTNQHIRVKTFTGLYGWIPTYDAGFVRMYNDCVLHI